MFGSGAGLVFTVIYPLVRPRLLSRQPRLRANALLGWAVAPMGIGCFFGTLLFIPTVLDYLGLPAGHCHNHAERLPHICLVNPLVSGSETIPWYFVAVLAFLLACILTVPGVHLYRVGRLKARLYAGRRTGTEYDLVVWKKPAAFTAGFWRPRIFLSTSLVQALPPKHIQVILAHENGHVHHRDPLRQYLGFALSFFHFPKTRKCILEDLILATEQACDEEAARKTGDRLQVAEAILAVERMLQGWPKSGEPAAAGFAGNNSALRIEALLAGGNYQQPVVPEWVLYSPPLAVTPLIMPGPVHSIIEVFIRHG